MDDIYGRELSFTKRSFVAETGHRVCRIKVSRDVGSTQWAWVGLATAFLAVLCRAVCFALNNSQYATVPTSIEMSACLILVGLVLFLSMTGSSPKDTLLVMESIGIQVVRESGWVWSRPTSLFLSLHSIHDVVIAETFFRHKIIFYLAILMKPESGDCKLKNAKMIPIFTDLLPRHRLIVEVYQEIISLLQFHQSSTDSHMRH